VGQREAGPLTCTEGGGSSAAAWLCYTGRQKPGSCFVLANCCARSAVGCGRHASKPAQSEVQTLGRQPTCRRAAALLAPGTCLHSTTRRGRRRCSTRTCQQQGGQEGGQRECCAVWGQTSTSVGGGNAVLWGPGQGEVWCGWPSTHCLRCLPRPCCSCPTHRMHSYIRSSLARSSLLCRYSLPSLQAVRRSVWLDTQTEAAGPGPACIAGGCRQRSSAAGLPAAIMGARLHCTCGLACTLAAALSGMKAGSAAAK